MSIGKILFIPAFLDYIITLCFFYAPSFIGIQIFYTGLANMIIIITFLNSCYLKKKLYPNHILGIFLVVYGLVLVGFMSDGNIKIS